ncbi:hypothetical protein [Streptomyces katsurahamanus]|uniref:Uncharacterized protein n=1 Tax=Streptomyces katsurahamanus TaxID=2577098 RepID=A0ABW9NRQ2_9ACTN|nr:hypothetical protein [Streptomyces katsurahamanus]MQS35992.1 hypothetical protein [Streptomyces katsurahamanus]
MAVADRDGACGRVPLGRTVVNLDSDSGGSPPRRAFEHITAHRTRLAAEPAERDRGRGRGRRPRGVLAARPRRMRSR